MICISEFLTNLAYLGHSVLKANGDLPLTRIQDRQEVFPKKVLMQFTRRGVDSNGVVNLNKGNTDFGSLVI